MTNLYLYPTNELRRAKPTIEVLFETSSRIVVSNRLQVLNVNFSEGTHTRIQEETAYRFFREILQEYL